MENDSTSTAHTVTCPQCGTRYRAPSGVVGGPTATYRCARCGHVFSPVADHRPGVPRPAAPPEPEEQAPAEDLPWETEPPDSDGPAFTRSGARADAEETEMPREPAFTAPAAEEPSEDSMRSPRSFSWLRLGVRFQAVIVVAFCVLGFYLVSHPEKTEQLVTSIPLLDAAMGTSAYLVDEIGIAGLQGSHERLRDERPAFVIVGQVVNNSSRTVGAVQIEGRIYGQTGEIARQAVYAGTRVSQRLVRSWTPAAIDMFAKLKPPKQYKLAAGASDDFLIIFRDIPADLKEFTCRVLTVQPTAGG